MSDIDSLSIHTGKLENDVTELYNGYTLLQEKFDNVNQQLTDIRDIIVRFKDKTYFNIKDYLE